MTPEDAYSILEAIAEINGYTHRLKKWKATAAEKKDEETAQEISEAHQERMKPFTFSMCNIAVGEQCLDKAEVCRKNAIYASAHNEQIKNSIAGCEAAIRLFESISGWKDADEQIYACQRKIEEIKAKERYCFLIHFVYLSKR